MKRWCKKEGYNTMPPHSRKPLTRKPPYKHKGRKWSTGNLSGHSDRLLSTVNWLLKGEDKEQEPFLNI